MTLLSVLAFAVAAVVLSPPAVRLLGRRAGWLFAALYVAAAATLVAALPGLGDDEPLRFSATWVPNFLGSGHDIAFSLLGDGLSVFFALLALVVGTFVFIYSVAYLHDGPGVYSFYIIMTAFMASVLLLMLAGDVIVLFVGWELVSIASFLLIARSGSSGEAGSVRTLILTFFGGLLLLAGFLIAATATGTTALDELLASPVWAQRPSLTTSVALLIAFGAFTKAAQFPFHFWLPEAMAAATPVSAFLHAAAVVKAGVYLLLRFSPLFADNAAWNRVLIVFGIGTAVMAAYFALGHTDLKKLTAYSTVSHLGWIVATIGVGTQLALVAALTHTLAHALFKSSLFMLIGVVDHQAGTRDIRRLGPLWRRMPWTCGSAFIAGASMAAIPPMFGFISKEAMLTAFTEAPLGGFGGGALLAAAAVGAVLTFLYTTKLCFGAFVDGPRDVSEVREAPVALWLPAALPGLLSLPLPFVTGYFGDWLAAGAGQDPHLAYWHGWTLPFFITVPVLLLGAAAIGPRRKLWALVDARPYPLPSGNDLLRALLSGLTRCGRACAAMASSLNPARHVVWVFALLIALGASTLLLTTGVDGVPLAPRVEGIDRLSDVVVLGIVAVSVFGIVRTHSRLSAVIFLGTTGVGVSLMMLTLGAPDVALTQFMVEALVVVIMMMVFRHQPDTFFDVPRRSRLLAAGLALLAGITAFLGVWTLLGRHERPPLAMWYLNNGPEISGGRNIVATILVEFRAFDTLGELSVLGMAAIVIGTLVASVPRSPFLKGTHPRPFGQSRLNSLPLRTLTKLLAPVLIVFGLIVFYRGHQLPGGGFIAALIWATAIMASYLSHGEDNPVFRKSTPYVLTGVGILTALFSGFLGLTHGSFLYAIHGHALGQHWTTSLIFDGGIVFAVLGMVTMAINDLGGYLRPGVDKLEDLDYMQDDNSPIPMAPALTREPDDDADYPGPLEPAAYPNQEVAK